MEWQKGPFSITTDRVDLPAVHALLAGSYWAKGIPLEVVSRSIEHSLCFSLFHGERQIGFARLITDRATFAYLADVIIEEGARGQGLGTWLVETIRSHPEVQGLRRWLLATKDAHDLYRRSGFRELEYPERFMEITRQLYLNA